jgi:DNA-directed RNA polymerase specialized sigma24 family protein
MPTSPAVVPEDRRQSIDWGLVLYRLAGRARYFKDKAPDIFDGVSVEDVVAEVLLRFFLDEHRLGWDPERGDLATFLWTFVKYRVIDRLRRSRHELSIQDDAVRVASEMEGVLLTDPWPGLAYQARLENLRSLVADNPELEKFLEAAKDASGPNINQQIAGILATTPEDVVNLKKRLKRLSDAAERGGRNHGRTI